MARVRVKVEELARCAVPYVGLPAGFQDPKMACEESDGRINTLLNLIIICDACERGWYKQCHLPHVARVPRGAWRCAESNDADAAFPVQSTALDMAAT